MRPLDAPLGLLFLLAAALASPALADEGPPALRLAPTRLPGWSEDVLQGEFPVFENRATRSGRRLALRVVVVPARAEKAEKAVGAVFYLAGGPGGSAVDTVTRAGPGFLASLRAERDLVFVDQRGTGGSHKLASELDGRTRDMARALGELFPVDEATRARDELAKDADLAMYGTDLAMDDLDDVRAALGYDKIDLSAGSYGTRAALVYLRRHGDHVRTATLYGVAPPTSHLPLSFAKGFDSALASVARDVAADEKARAAFPDLVADLDAALARLDAGPVVVRTANPLTREPVEVRLGRATFVEVVRILLYLPEGTRWLPLLLRKAAAGDFTLLCSVGYQMMSAIESQISRATNFSVLSSEDIAFIGDDDVKREMTGTRYGTARLDAMRRVAAIWPKADVPKSFAEPVRSDVPVLLLSGDGDPVTPPFLAEEAARTLPNSRHAVVPHTGHYFSFPEVEALVAEFMSSGSTKGLDAKIAALANVRRPPFVLPESLAAMAGSAEEKKAAAPPTQGSREDVYRGSLAAGGATFRLVVHVITAPDGSTTATLDSLDQGASGIPIGTCVRKDGKLHLELPAIGASFDGTERDGGASIRGEWTQGGHAFPLELARDDPPAAK